MEISKVVTTLMNVQLGVKTCIEKGKYAEAAQLAAAYGSILQGLGEKQLDKLLSFEDYD